ncbi:MFS transporter [Amycolatopsis kentuckyensis]|uniref:MFS transporter n=1 Tax=Amycolatopsis kentuckyensis TaxID=218823 RepID=UPI000A3D0D97|nr:MFS transporter [Amycolatopsis kentuckyensis]
MATPHPEVAPLATGEHRENGPDQARRLTGQPVGRLFVGLYVLAIVGLWIALLTPASVTLALRIADLDPAGKASSLALVTGVGAIFAMVSNPVFGRLSDLCTSRWGRRRPFMVGGAACGVVSLFVIGVAPSIPVVLLGWCLTQLALNAAVAALIAVLPDRVPERRRGTVSGLMGMTNQVAQVAGTFLVQFTGTRGLGMFLVPAAIGLVLVLAFACYLREVPQARAELPRLSWSDIPRSLWVNPLRHRDFAWAFLSRFLVWIGKSLLLTYKTYFLMDHLGYSSARAAAVLGWTMLILGIGVVVASNVAGWLSDRLRRRKVFIVAASLIFGTGMVVIATSATLTGFLVGVAIAGIGQGTYVGVDYALVASVLPDSDTAAAKGMGVFNIANALPQTVAPAIAPVFLAIGGGQNYAALYLSAAGFAIVGAIAAQFIRAVR